MTIHMYTNQVFWATMHGLQGQGPCHFENILQVEKNLQLIVVTKLGQCPKLRSVYGVVSQRGGAIDSISNRVPGIQTDMDPSWIPSCYITPPTIPVTVATTTATHTCIIPTFPPSQMPRSQPSPSLSPGPKKRPLSQNQAERDMQEELKREKTRTHASPLRFETPDMLCTLVCCVHHLLCLLS